MSKTVKIEDCNKMSETQSDSIKVVSSDNPNSIWSYFGKLYLNESPAVDDDGRYCSLCENRYSNTTSATVLMRHLLNVHQIDLKATQKNVSDICNSTFKPSTAVEKKHLLGRRLALLMCRDSLPASHLTTPAFRDLLEQVSGGELKSEDFPSAQKINGSALDEIYAATRGPFLEELKKAPEVITVTSENWTDASANVAYVNVGLQFIDSESTLHQYHLSTEVFERPHNAKRQAERIEEILQEAGLGSRLFWFVLGDKSAFNIACVKEMKNCLGHVGCIAHGIHLLLMTDIFKADTAEQILEVLRKVKQTHEKLYRQWEEELKEMVEASEKIRYTSDCDDLSNGDTFLDQLADVKHIPKKNVTRWMTSCAMLKSYKDNEEEITTLLSGLNAVDLMLDPDQFDIFQSMLKFYEIFESTTVLLQSSNEPSSHLVILFRHQIEEKLKAFKDDETTHAAVAEIARLALNRLPCRMPIGDEFLCASLLDPLQAGSNFVEKYVPHDQAINKLQAMYDKLQLEDLQPCSPLVILKSQSIAPQMAVQSSLGLSEPPLKKFRREMLERTRSESSISRPLLDEYILYLSTAKTSDEDVLDFWKKHKTVFPKLAKLSKAVFGLNATSASNERSFSLSGIVGNYRTSRLEPERIQQKLFVKENFKFLKMTKRC